MKAPPNRNASWKPSPTATGTRLRGRIATNEFSCLCPKTGQPTLPRYSSDLPDQKIVESKSLKLYLWTYRDEGVFHEHFANLLLNDLVDALDPKWCRVEVDFNARGGIGIKVLAEHGTPPESR